MSKWRVRIEGGGGWAVFNPDRGSKRWFSAHAEALAYADRQARTREYVLPPTAHLTTSTVRTRPSGDGMLVEWKAGPRWEAMRTTQNEIRPLALALLAHAERLGQ